MPKDTFNHLSEEKKEKIMRASIHEFNEHGFEKGNVGEIARQAGIAKGSMYQYFENKSELFLDTVKWAMGFLEMNFSKFITIQDKTMDIFDYLYQNAKAATFQMREERGLAVFIQNVFLGKFRELSDETMDYMLKMSDEYILNMIRVGKENGSVRKDIDDNILSLFVIGVSYKIKEYLMKKARNNGQDIIDEDYEVYENEIKAMIELLKHGMGGK